MADNEVEKFSSDEEDSFNKLQVEFEIENNHPEQSQSQVLSPRRVNKN